MIRDRINLLYTDTSLSLEENADELSAYMTKLRQAVFDALKEEACWSSPRQSTILSKWNTFCRFGSSVYCCRNMGAALEVLRVVKATLRHFFKIAFTHPFHTPTLASTRPPD
jgi:hypothetical protein